MNIRRYNADTYCPALARGRRGEVNSRVQSFLCVRLIASQSEGNVSFHAEYYASLKEAIENAQARHSEAVAVIGVKSLVKVYYNFQSVVAESYA
jgi:hypothetical protein